MPCQPTEALHELGRCAGLIDQHVLLGFPLEVNAHLNGRGADSERPSDGFFSLLLRTEAMDLAHRFGLPVITLVVASVGPYVYAVRTMTINVAQGDHVTVARAKGMSEKIISRRHILRVASPPIVTGLILGFTGTLGGSILVETVFNWQGMGRLYYEAIAGTPDEMVIVAITFVYNLIYVVARMIIEVIYVLLDTRVRYG